MRRLAWIVACALAVLLAVYVATRVERRAPPSSQPNAVASSIDGAGPDLSDPRERTEATERAELEAAPPPRTERAATNAWQVCVVDGATGVPVAGATVSVLDSNAIAELTTRRGVGYDTQEGLRLRAATARSSRTGADGCVAINDPPRSASVEARLGSLWAFTVVNVPPPDGRVLLRLGPDRELRVRVVDLAGAPVGEVPVALRKQVQPQPRPSFTYKWTDTSAEDGVATFLHFQRRLEQGAGWHATLAFPTRDEFVVPVDAATPLDPPIELVLGGAGALRIRVRGADGTAFEPRGAELRVDAFASATTSERLWPDGPWSRPFLDDDGEALVPWLGLGLHLRVALVRDEVELAASELSGPARSGEAVSCELTVREAPAPRVRGRFVLDDGRPWPAATVQSQLEFQSFPERVPEQPDVVVGADGRFEIEVRRATPDDCVLALRLWATHPTAGGRVGLRLPLPTALPPDGLELGDVLFDRGAPLVAGRVVDTDGKPLFGATFSLQVRSLARGQEFWPGLPHSGLATSDTAGRFALFAVPGDEPSDVQLRLTSRCSGHVDERSRPVRVGECDVEVVLARAGALAGTLELAHGLGVSNVVAFLESPQREFVQLRPDATFEVQELLPGSYSFAVWRKRPDGSRESEPAALVENLLVRSGETCRDARLQPLRIESPYSLVRIRCVDGARSPLPNVAVAIVGVDNPRPPLSNLDGVCRVLATALPVDLELAAFGYLSARVSGVSGDREVVLERGLPIRLRANARTDDLGAPPHQLNLQLTLLDARDSSVASTWRSVCTPERMRFDARGELALRVPAAGEYRCDLFVTLQSGGVGRGAALDLQPPLHIGVLASEAEQTFDLEFSRAALDAALAEALR